MAETEVTQEQWSVVTDLTLRQQARKMLADENLYPFNGKQITLREALEAGGGKATSPACAPPPRRTSRCTT